MNRIEIPPLEETTWDAKQIELLKQLKDHINNVMKCDHQYEDYYLMRFITINNNKLKNVRRVEKITTIQN